VDICDSGSGFPEEVRARIFEPFFTTKDVDAGSGLGLHIVRSIVDRNAGRIEVESAPGRTCFSVSLPGRVPPRT
jgi:signal transduction histidine kinase